MIDDFKKPTAHPLPEDFRFSRRGRAEEPSGGGAVSQATETVLGGAEIATTAEAVAGVSDLQMLTPLKLAQTLAALGLSGVTIGEAEIDFGATPIFEKSFVVAAVGVTSAMRVIAAQSHAAATGRTADENAWDKLHVSSIAGMGQIEIHAYAYPGPVSGKYKINYLVR